MIDYAKITVQAGNGGRGSGSRTQIKGKRYGRADGGDGGRGGDLYFIASTDLNTLEPYRFLKHYEAKNGQNGFSNLRRGASGGNLELKVPVGTQIKVDSKDLNTNQFPQITDLVAAGDKVLIARGGQGGRGNAHLRDEYGRRPRIGDPGKEGEKLDLILELKLIANVGLIGLPNAGKSTLLSKLTSATPKIAGYPFTTLEPNLGVFKKGTTWRKSTTGITGSDQKALGTRDTLTTRDTLIFADIPGLIEGASQGKGLGDLFLRHIERTTLLVHLIDITDDKLWENYQTIKTELKNYSKTLAKKKEIIVLNKTDLVNADQVQSAINIFKNHRKKVLVLSAEYAEGLETLIKEIFKKLKPKVNPSLLQS